MGFLEPGDVERRGSGIDGQIGCSAVAAARMGLWCLDLAFQEPVCALLPAPCQATLRLKSRVMPDSSYWVVLEWKTAREAPR